MVCVLYVRKLGGDEVLGVRWGRCGVGRALMLGLKIRELDMKGGKRER